MFVHEPTAELWSDSRVKCVLVPHGQQVEVELRNADGSAFLRKTAPTREAALDEAEYLRLLLCAANRPKSNRDLKPFALVIEDDTNSADAVSDALRVSGMRTLGCRTGADGVARARELSPDLVVVGNLLPDLTGAEVCQQLRASGQTAATPVIALTASPEALRAQGCQADAVLSTPCQIDTLVAAARLFVRHLARDPDAAS